MKPHFHTCPMCQKDVSCTEDCAFVGRNQAKGESDVLFGNPFVCGECKSAEYSQAMSSLGDMTERLKDHEKRLRDVRIVLSEAGVGAYMIEPGQSMLTKEGGLTGTVKGRLVGESERVQHLVKLRNDVELKLNAQAAQYDELQEAVTRSITTLGGIVTEPLTHALGNAAHAARRLLDNKRQPSAPPVEQSRVEVNGDTELIGKRIMAWYAQALGRKPTPDEIESLRHAIDENSLRGEVHKLVAMLVRSGAIKVEAGAAEQIEALPSGEAPAPGSEAEAAALRAEVENLRGQLVAAARENTALYARCAELKTAADSGKRDHKDLMFLESHIEDAEGVVNQLLCALGLFGVSDSSVEVVRLVAHLGQVLDGAQAVVKERDEARAQMSELEMELHLNVGKEPYATMGSAPQDGTEILGLLDLVGVGRCWRVLVWNWIDSVDYTKGQWVLATPCQHMTPPQPIGWRPMIFGPRTKTEQQLETDLDEAIGRALKAEEQLEEIAHLTGGFVEGKEHAAVIVERFKNQGAALAGSEQRREAERREYDRTNLRTVLACDEQGQEHGTESMNLIDIARVVRAERDKLLLDVKEIEAHRVAIEKTMRDVGQQRDILSGRLVTAMSERDEAIAARDVLYYCGNAPGPGSATPDCRACITCVLRQYDEETQRYADVRGALARRESELTLALEATGQKLVDWRIRYAVLAWGIDAAKKLREPHADTCIACSHPAHLIASTDSEDPFGVRQSHALSILVSNGAVRILNERFRQKLKGFDAEHDIKFSHGELAWAAVVYAAPGPVFDSKGEDLWPFETDIRDDRAILTRSQRLERAGAFIAAELDVIDAQEARDADLRDKQALKAGELG